MIMPQRTGHVRARDGHIWRVDIITGPWVATRFTPNLVISQEVVGSDELVHQQITRWLART
jgi:hypothetical protein